MNLAILRNLRKFGADGLLLDSIVRDPEDWVIVSLSDSTSIDLDCRYIGRHKLYVIPRCLRGGWGRLIDNFLLFCFLFYVKSRYKSPKNLVCSSTELAFIAGLYFGRVLNKYYLFSDLTGFHLSKKTSYIVKKIDEFCLKLGFVPVVTSPGFIFGYFSKLKNYKKSHIVHNIEPALAGFNRADKHLSGKNIVWAGLLRCNYSLLLLDKLIEIDPSFKVSLAGPTNFLEKNLVNKFMFNPQVTSFGLYNASDLNIIYKDADYVWCCDWSLGVNSELLLSNRIYHAIETGTPIICSAGSLVSKIVNAYGIGVEISNNEFSVFSLSSVTDSEYAQMCINIKSLKNKKCFLDDSWDGVISGKSREFNGDNVTWRLFDE